MVLFSVPLRPALWRRFSGLLLGALLVGALSVPALAGDDAAPAAARDYVAELTSEELGFLRQRIQDWDAMEASQRQRIAQNVLRLRNLSEEGRKQFRRKIDHFTKAGGDAPHAKERLEQLKRDGTRMLFTRGLGALARRELGMEQEAALLERGVSTNTLDMLFSRMFWERAVQSAGDTEPPAPDSLPAGVSPESRQRYAEAHARYVEAEGPARERMRRYLGFKHAMLQSELLRQSAARTDLASSDAYALALGQRLREAWPQAFAAVLDSVRANPDAFVQAAERSETQRAVEGLSRGRGRLSKEELRLLVVLADRAATHNAAERPQLRERVDQLLRSVLVDELGLPQEAVDGLPARSEPEAREAALRHLLKLPGHHGSGPHRRGGFGPRRGPPK